MRLWDIGPNQAVFFRCNARDSFEVAVEELDRGR
jgi:hypothetical protein